MTQHEPAPAPAKHETRDIDVKKVALSGVVFFVIGFGSLAVGRPIYDALVGATRQSELPTTPDPEVRAQRMLDPRAEMKAALGDEARELREREADSLSSYGWINQEKGVAHV